MDDQSRDEIRDEKTGPVSFFAKLYRPGPLVVLFTLAFAALVALGYSILTDTTPPDEVATAAGMVIQAEPVAVVPRVYEEDTSGEMEDMVRQADLAIIEAMRGAGMDLARLGLLDVELRTLDGRPYHYQVLDIPPLKDKSAFLAELKNRLAVRAPDAVLTGKGNAEAVIAIASLPTHRLMLETVPMTLPRPTGKGPMLAIVIDDIGEDLHILNGLINLNFPVTLAVWPNASQSRESVSLIQASGRDLIIHFPMEPMGYPAYNPGSDALFTTMSEEAIRKRVADSLARIPEAIGVNNHMGSKFTAHTPGMTTALSEFKRRGLFFLDSLTSGRSVARSVARQTDTPFYQRDIFLDNVKDVSAITLQLRKAENVALKNGVAIAIGHPYPETLAALKAWHARRNPDIRVLPLSLLKPQ